MAQTLYTTCMKMLLSSIALLAAPLFADSIPAGWMVLKDMKGVCQIGAPGDFKRDENFKGLGKGPGDAVEVQIMSSAASVKPINEAVGKMMNIDKFVDNTDQRVFYVAKPNKVKDGRTVTAWTVKVPRGTGNCFATITVVPGGQEELVKRIAATIGPAK
jgi:hypothetical protein